MTSPTILFRLCCLIHLRLIKSESDGKLIRNYRLRLEYGFQVLEAQSEVIVIKIKMIDLFMKCPY